MQPETRFKIRLRKRLEKIPNSGWVKISQRSICGTPDVFGVIRGRAIILELKTDVGRVSALQGRNLYKWKRSGAYTAVIMPSNEDEIIAELEAL